MSSTPNLSQIAYGFLRDKIMSGEFEPGFLLNEGLIASELGLSRTPVRQAVTRLAEAGLVEAKPHHRARVVGWDLEKMYSTYSIRALLEGEAAALAAKSATPEEVMMLEQLADQMESLDDPEHVKKLSEVNVHFHRTITAMSKKITLIQAIENISYQPMMMFGKEHLGQVYRDNVHYQHRDIIEAIKTADSEWAMIAMRSHILAARNAGCVAPYQQKKVEGTEEADG